MRNLITAFAMVLISGLEARAQNTVTSRLPPPLADELALTIARIDDGTIRLEAKRTDGKDYRLRDHQIIPVVRRNDLPTDSQVLSVHPLGKENGLSLTVVPDDEEDSYWLASPPAFRVPDETFANLPGWDHEPHYFFTKEGYRMAYYLFEPAEGVERKQVSLVLTTNEIGWSYGYKDVVGPLTEAGFTVYSVDFLGYGRSDKPPWDVHRLHAASRWFLDWFDSLRLEKTILVAGAGPHLTAALRTAVDREDIVKGVVTFGGTFPIGEPSDDPEEPVVTVPLINGWLWAGFSGTAFLVEYEMYIQPSPAVLEAIDTQFMNGNQWMALPVTRYIAEIPKSIHHPDAPLQRAYWEALGKLETPILLNGTTKPFYPQDLFQVGKAHLPGATKWPELETLSEESDEVAWWPALEKPDWWLEKVLGFVSLLEAKGWL